MGTKWSAVSPVFVQRKAKHFQRQKNQEENLVGRDIERDGRERVWLYWSTCETKIKNLKQNFTKTAITTICWATIKRRAHSSKIWVISLAWHLLWTQWPFAPTGLVLLARTSSIQVPVTNHTRFTKWPENLKVEVVDVCISIYGHRTIHCLSPHFIPCGFVIGTYKCLFLPKAIET